MRFPVFLAILGFSAFSTVSVSAQKKMNTDSVMAALKVAKDDTSKVMALSNLAIALQPKDPDKAIAVGKDGIILADKLKFNSGKADCFHGLGLIYYYKGQYDRSLENYLSSMKLLETLHKSEKGNLKVWYQRRIADNLHDIGKVYYRQKQHKISLATFDKALMIYKNIKYQRGISGCYNNMAGVYDALGDFDKTLYYLQESLKIAKQLGHKQHIATGMNNIGLCYQMQGKYDQALQNFHKALKMREELGDIKGLAYSYTDMGQLYLEKKEYQTALSYFIKALDYSKQASSKEREKSCYEELATTYAHLGNMSEAYKYQKLLGQLKDSMFNNDAMQRIAEMTAKYETDKKEQEIVLLNKEKQIKANQLAASLAEAKSQQMQKLAFASGFILVFALGLGVLRGYKQKQKAHALLSIQKEVIEEKNKEILDSIYYAKRIQEALLKEEDHVSSHLPEHFILFRPKDIVSGDFYWAFEKHGHWYLAVADCTGHGVPGAFMSMLGIAFLNEITASDKLLAPSEILDQLRSKIVKELRQRGQSGETRDGMDISLLRMDLQSRKVMWAGANNPLWIFRKNESGNFVISEIKGDKQPIGYHPLFTAFTDHEIELNEGDHIYLFSDGFADQFGGVKGKKFKYRQLQENIATVITSPLPVQKEKLQQSFDDWKGTYAQVDDVCMVGVRV